MPSVKIVNLRSRSIKELRLASRMALTLQFLSVLSPSKTVRERANLHFFGVADVANEIAADLNDFVTDLVVGLKQHFDFSVVIF